MTLQKRGVLSSYVFSRNSVCSDSKSEQVTDDQCFAYATPAIGKNMRREATVDILLVPKPFESSCKFRLRTRIEANPIGFCIANALVSGKTEGQNDNERTTNRYIAGSCSLSN